MHWHCRRGGSHGHCDQFQRMLERFVPQGQLYLHRLSSQRNYVWSKSCVQKLAPAVIPLVQFPWMSNWLTHQCSVHSLLVYAPGQGIQECTGQRPTGSTHPRSPCAAVDQGDEKTSETIADHWFFVHVRMPTREWFRQLRICCKWSLDAM